MNGDLADGEGRDAEGRTSRPGWGDSAVSTFDTTGGEGKMVPPERAESGGFIVQTQHGN